uniref:Cytochrome P450 20A1 n=1 Tax=Nothoprocta perdicaria TaxID=30464 RepID=A0A8C6ZFK2_NOTPE
MLDFAIFAVTFLLILVGAVLYLYPASRQASGIPGLAPTDEKDGNLPDITASGSLHEFLRNLHEKHGPLVSFWFGRRLVVSLGAIELLKQHVNPNRLRELPFACSWAPFLGLLASGVQGSYVSLALLILSEELLAKWLSLPEAQHVPLCQHMLGFAMKSVTQTALGSSFEDDREVIRFRRNHDAVSDMKSRGFLCDVFPKQQHAAYICV